MQQDTVGETIRDMETEKVAMGAGIRRLPKSRDLRALTVEALQALFTNPDSTPLEVSIFERELIRREADAQWDAEVVKGVNPQDEVALARAKVKGWVLRFITGEKTAAQAAWEVSKVLKLTYKDGEIVVSGAYAMHDSEGVEASKGWDAGWQSRNLIPPVLVAAWESTLKAEVTTVEELSTAIKAALAAADPSRNAPRVKAERTPRVKAERIAREPKPRKEREPRAREAGGAMARMGIAPVALPATAEDMAAFFG